MWQFLNSFCSKTIIIIMFRFKSFKRFLNQCTENFGFDDDNSKISIFVDNSKITIFDDNSKITIFDDNSKISIFDDYEKITIFDNSSKILTFFR